MNDRPRIGPAIYVEVDGAHSAALVTKVLDARDGLVNLITFPDGMLEDGASDFGVARRSIRLDEVTFGPKTWHRVP